MKKIDWVAVAMLGLAFGTIWAILIGVHWHKTINNNLERQKLALEKYRLEMNCPIEKAD